jgi:hypothetical protein
MAMMDLDPTDMNWRIFKQQVTFSKPFSAPPDVTFGLRYLDGQHDSNTRFYVWAEDVTETGFTAGIGTWADTHIFGIRFNWLALGQGRLQAGNGGTTQALANPGSDSPFISAAARTVALQTTITPELSFENGKIAANFSAIPGRTYFIESPADLVHWQPVGATTANDFTAGIAFDEGQSPAFFLRAFTP